MNKDLLKKAILARNAFLKTSVSTKTKRNNVLQSIFGLLGKNRQKILAANKLDEKNAKKLGMKSALIKRLQLSDEKITELAEIVSSIKKQSDVLGKELSRTILDDRLVLSRKSVPLGVVFAVFEARPDAVVQVSCLCIKTGNSVILKGGSEAKNTNSVLAGLIRKALKNNGFPKDSVQMVKTRKDVMGLLSLSGFIDLVVPRGSKEFVKFIQKNSSIPVLGHSDGICHEYVDKDANLQKAVKICVDAKCQYPAACNSMETLLVNRSVAKDFLPMLAKELNGAVELRADKNAFRIISSAGFSAKKASETDWKTEYNDLVLSIKIVKDVNEAIAHINKFGSKHSDGIISENKKTADQFLREIDSSSVMWNASTRFADGYRYGLGAELGISTGKTHSRGPSGMQALTTYKYLLKGSGQTVKEYTGTNAKKFRHKKIF